MTFDLEQTAATVGGRDFTFADLVLVAVLDGTWDGFLQRAATGAASLAAGAEQDPARVKLAGRAFRYQRRLLTADELRAWLAERDLDHGAWQAHFARWQAADEAADAAIDGPADAITDTWWVDAYVAGLWITSVERLGGWWAAAQLVDVGADADADEQATAPTVPALGASTQRLLDLAPDELAARLGRLATWQAAGLTLTEQLSREDAVASVVRQSPLDWTTFDVSELRVGSEGAAREARLCLADGMAVEELAEHTGATVERGVTRFTDVERTVGAVLAAAQPGDIVGPVELDDAWLVGVLHERHQPSPEDPEVRERIGAVLVDDALERALAGKLRQVAPL